MADDKVCCICKQEYHPTKLLHCAHLSTDEHFCSAVVCFNCRTSYSKRCVVCQRPWVSIREYAKNRCLSTCLDPLCGNAVETKLKWTKNAKATYCPEHAVAMCKFEPCDEPLAEGNNFVCTAHLALFENDAVVRYYASGNDVNEVGCDAQELLPITCVRCGLVGDYTTVFCAASLGRKACKGILPKHKSTDQGLCDACFCAFIRERGHVTTNVRHCTTCGLYGKHKSSQCAANPACKNSRQEIELFCSEHWRDIQANKVLFAEYVKNK